MPTSRPLRASPPSLATCCAPYRPSRQARVRRFRRLRPRAGERVRHTEVRARAATFEYDRAVALAADLNAVDRSRNDSLKISIARHKSLGHDWNPLGSTRDIDVPRSKTAPHEMTPIRDSSPARGSIRDAISADAAGRAAHSDSLRRRVSRCRAADCLRECERVWPNPMRSRRIFRIARVPYTRQAEMNKVCAGAARRNKPRAYSIPPQDPVVHPRPHKEATMRLPP